MAGWKIEFGMRYKGVLTLIDYQALREGKIVTAQAPDREVYTRDKVVFPLADVAEKALEKFSNPSAEALEPQDPLPIPFVEDTPEARQKSRRVYITYSRIQRLGMTPGCRACYAQTRNHTPECIARHEEAFGHELPEPPPRESEELEDLFDEVAPPELDLQEDFPPPADSDYEPSIGPHDPLDDDEVPECPPPSDDEGPLSDGPHEVERGVGAIVSIASDFKNALPDDEIQDVFGVVLSQPERSRCLGATAMSSEATKGRHLLQGGVCYLNFAVMRIPI